MAEQKLVDVNVKGKVVVPLPELIRGMATKSITIVDSDYKHSLYAVAFGRLINRIVRELTLEKNALGQYEWVKCSQFVGYATLDTFQTFTIHPNYDDVNFTLGENSSWTRPFYFHPYVNETDETKALKRVSAATDLEYPTFETKKFEADPSDSFNLRSLNAEDIRIDKVVSNIRTTNAFIRKFGWTIDNPNFQSDLDQNLNLMKKYSK